MTGRDKADWIAGRGRDAESDAGDCLVFNAWSARHAEGKSLPAPRGAEDSPRQGHSYFRRYYKDSVRSGGGRRVNDFVNQHIGRPRRGGSKTSLPAYPGLSDPS